MIVPDNIKEEFSTNGFAVIENVFNDIEIEKIFQAILNADKTNPSFRKNVNLFAIRQFLIEVPAVKELVFNKNLNSLVSKIFGNEFFVVKSIYFDKPEGSNWFVSYHQDLTISVDKKLDIKGFEFWTSKQNQFSVQPPLKILEDNVTVRIHLDDTNEENGALKVIPKSHLKGIYRAETIDWSKETENTCSVKKGGVMLMKPLLLHSSGRTINKNRRRVIHIEFSRSLLCDNLNWSELIQLEEHKNLLEL